MDTILLIIAGVVGAILVFLKGGKGKKQKEFWDDIKKKMAEAQEKEEELNKPIEDGHEELTEIEGEIENVRDARVTAAEAVRLMRERFGWDTPDSDDE